VRERFEYSIEALNVINRFHKVEKIVYVEGEDDVLFWEIIFEKFATFSTKIEDAGGKEELKKLSEKVISGEANFLVAMDSDYDKITDNTNHKNLIFTFGYSIENTIINSASLHKILRNLSKLPKRELPTSVCEEWLNSLESSVKKMIVFDLLNHKNKHGIKVIPDNCDRLMTSKSSCYLCNNKIEDYLEKTGILVEDESYNLIESDISSLKIRYIDIIRGHFLFSSALRFVKVKVANFKSNVSISREMFFGALVSAFETVFDPTHPHFSYYREVISLTNQDLTS